MYKQPTDPVAAGEALKFFAWAYANGDKMAEALDYVPPVEFEAHYYGSNESESLAV